MYIVLLYIKKHLLLSVILLSYQSERNLISTVEVIRNTLIGEQIPFELIIMDDGSTDKSYSYAKLLETQYSEIQAFQLSKNWGSTANLFSGITQSKGGAITVMHDDLQLPISVIVKMYKLWLQGNKIIFPTRRSRGDDKKTKWFSSLYYLVMNNFTDVNIPKSGTDGFLIDKEIAPFILKKFPRHNTIAIELLQIGYNPLFLPFDRPSSTGVSRWSRKKRVKLALNTFYNASSIPIKLISFIGVFMFILSIIGIISMVVTKLFFDNSLFGFTIPGWTTTIIFITFFNGLILLSIGIISEYIWRIYKEVKGRAAFIIKK